jgi:hypothetical protein
VPFRVDVVPWPPTSRVTEVELLDSEEVLSVALAAPIEVLEAPMLLYVLVSELSTVLVDP